MTRKVVDVSTGRMQRVLARSEIEGLLGKIRAEFNAKDNNKLAQQARQLRNTGFTIVDFSREAIAKGFNISNPAQIDRIKKSIDNNLRKFYNQFVTFEIQSGAGRKLKKSQFTRDSVYFVRDYNKPSPDNAVKEVTDYLVVYSEKKSDTFRRARELMLIVLGALAKDPRSGEFLLDPTPSIQSTGSAGTGNTGASRVDDIGRTIGSDFDVVRLTEKGTPLVSDTKKVHGGHIGTNAALLGLSGTILRNAETIGVTTDTDQSFLTALYSVLTNRRIDITVKTLQKSNQGIERIIAEFSNENTGASPEEKRHAQEIRELLEGDLAALAIQIEKLVSDPKFSEKAAILWSQSPSRLEDLTEYLLEVGAPKDTKKKAKRKTKTGTRGKVRSKKANIKKPQKVKSRGKKVGGVPQGTAEVIEQNTGFMGTYMTLGEVISIINNEMHDYLRENMGKGGAKETLNYRTGRFARSAEVVSMRQTGRSLDIGISYMRAPYDVFLPGHKLYKPLRNPVKLIGKSTRQILQDFVGRRINARINLV